MMSSIITSEYVEEGSGGDVEEAVTTVAEGQMGLGPPPREGPFSPHPISAQGDSFIIKVGGHSSFIHHKKESEIIHYHQSHYSSLSYFFQIYNNFIKNLVH